MSSAVAIKHTPQKKQISQKEYDHREEWEPETIKDYQVFSSRPAPVTVHQKRHQQQRQPSQQQQQHQSQTTSAGIVQGRVPGRRSQIRSSSLFEEWKTKALRNPLQPSEPTVFPPNPSKRSNKSEGVAASGDARGSLGDKLDKAGNAQSNTKPANDAHGRQPATTKAVGVNTELPSSIQFPSALRDSSIEPTANIRKKASRRGRKQDGSERQQQHPKDRGQEQSAYVAPNGTRFDTSKLRQLGLGIKIEGKHVVYFLPCFVEDPWKDMKPSPYIRPAKVMNRS